MLTQARTLVEGQTAEEDRLAALRVLGWIPEEREAELAVLERLLMPQQSGAVQAAALSALGRMPEEKAAATVTAAWQA